MASIGVVTSIGSVGPSGTPDVSVGNAFIAGQTPWGIDGVAQVCTSFSSYLRLYGGLNKLVTVGSPDTWTFETLDALVQNYYAIKSYFAEKSTGSPGVLYFSRVIASSSGPVAASTTVNDVTSANPTTFTSKWKASAGNTKTIAVANPGRRAQWVAGAGTVTTTSSSGAVTGSGTAFAATQVGQGIQIGGVGYIIATFVSGTSITVSPNVVTGAAGQTYSTAQPTCTITAKFPQANITEVWDIASTADALTASQRSELVTITLPAGATLPTNAATTKLASGTDGASRFNASDADYVGTTSAANVKTGLQVFNDQRLGVGYVGIPGKYSATVRSGVATHAAAFYRLWPFSSPSGIVLNTAVADLNGQTSNLGAYYTPQVLVPDENSDSGGQLTIDNCGAIMGLAARMIRDYSGGPHKSPAGKSHPFLSINNIERQSSNQELYDDAASGTLADSNINTIRLKPSPVVWGNRTIATDARWRQFNSAQTNCLVIVTGQLILEKYVFEPIDAQGKLFGKVASDFKVFMLDLFRKGALFGTEPGSQPKPSDAFLVVCDRTNNPDSVIVNNEFKVDLTFAPTPNAERVTFTVSPAAPGFASGRAA